MSKNKTAKKMPKPKKDEGPLYRVIDAQGRVVYPGKGLPKREAQRLADGLLAPANIQPVDGEGTIIVTAYMNVRCHRVDHPFDDTYAFRQFGVTTKTLWL